MWNKGLGKLVIWGNKTGEMLEEEVAVERDNTDQRIGELSWIKLESVREPQTLHL